MSLTMDQIHSLRNKGVKWSDINITDTLRKQYYEWVRAKPYANLKLWQLSEEDKPKKRVVGVIGDLHIPFEHKDYFNFIVDTFIEWRVTEIVFIGDLVDNHAISRHETSTRAESATREYHKTLSHLKKWVTEFPTAKMCIGNHDTIPERQLASIGMPSFFLKSYRNLWKLPKTWEIEHNFVIDNVYYFHGINSVAKDGALNATAIFRMSVVQGHAHSYLGCKFLDNGINRVFGLNTGCGVDNSAYAMEYGKDFLKKPTLGCGVVINSSEAYAIPMNEEYYDNIRIDIFDI